MYISWIIPVRNGERLLEKSIGEVDGYLKAKNFPGGYEILIVADNRSTDKTIAVAEGLKKTYSALRVTAGAHGGKGGAVQAGMRSATGDIRLFSDADNATSPEHFDKMIPLFEQGFDIVISSRNPKDAPGAVEERAEGLLRIVAGRLGNLWIQVLAVPGIWDTQNGFKAFRAKAAEEIFSRTRMLGFSFDIEVLALARRLKHKIGFIPVHWVHDPNSTVTMGAYIAVLLDVLKIRWNLVRRVYKLP